MMDFGCGLGQDGLHFARKLGLRVTFADIVPSNAALTARFLNPNGLFVVMLYTASHFARTGAATLDEYAVKSEAPAPIEVANPYSDFYDVPKAVSLFEGFDLLDQWAGYKELFGWYVFGRRAVSV
jgi:hypothetical protein